MPFQVITSTIHSNLKFRIALFTYISWFNTNLVFSCIIKGTLLIRFKESPLEVCSITFWAIRLFALVLLPKKAALSSSYMINKYNILDSTKTHILFLTIHIIQAFHWGASWVPFTLFPLFQTSNKGRGERGNTRIRKRHEGGREFMIEEREGSR